MDVGHRRLRRHSDVGFRHHHRRRSDGKEGLDGRIRRLGGMEGPGVRLAVKAELDAHIHHSDAKEESDAPLAGMEALGAPPDATEESAVRIHRSVSMEEQGARPDEKEGLDVRSDGMEESAVHIHR
jgi:hypothetical protein